jgi:imidazolonepropionase-like amidohydrolase
MLNIITFVIQETIYSKILFRTKSNKIKLNMNKKIVALLVIVLLGKSYAQETFPINGIKEKEKTTTAFKNATIHIDYRTVIEKGVLVIKDGKIISVSSGDKVPNGAVVHDLKGKHIYPSFIDLNSNYGMPEVKRAERGFGPQELSNKKGAYNWNQAVKPEVNAFEQFSPDEKSAKDYINSGFGSVLTHQMDGIVRGTSVLTLLSNTSANKAIVKEKAGAHFSFSKGSSTQDYPSSLMGSIALLRQTYLDAQWYATIKNHEEVNLSLAAFNQLQNIPQIFDVTDKLSLLRADKIGDEFGVQYIIKGNGDEYQRIHEVKQSGASIILPVNFPLPYDVSDPYEAMLVSLEDMKHWELAPTNPAVLEKNGILFSFTTTGLKEKKSFLANIKKAIEHGLSEEMALRALTFNPAQFLGVQDKLGVLKEGAFANFIITSDKLFADNTIIYQNWVGGQNNSLENYDVVDVRGEYNLNVNQDIRTLKVNGELSSPKAEISYQSMADSVNANGDVVLDPAMNRPYKVKKTQTVKVVMKRSDNQIALSYQIGDGLYSLAGVINFDSGSWDGRGTLPDGSWTTWTAIRKKKEDKKKEDKPADKDSLIVGNVTFPNMAYGFDSIPKAGTILIKGATVWTLETQGTLVTDVLVKDGKIKHIGDILDSADPKAIVIDGKGKHLTPGIIDEHSHIAISRGVNEGTQASTAEVSISDVVNSDDINIYRQLSGGVVAAQLLHGSANPIGGQSALIKLRWGKSPEEMKIENAPKFIKFALGENVKQSNWGDFNTTRFPQSRMGVEQVYYDHFIRAKEYEQEWKTYTTESKKKKNLTPPRRDLEMDVLVEILNSQRFVSCHSYVQSEINMLMHVADSMGFTLNTFTHILEGYKVADKMKAHGAGGSTFSDWWAYKYEVKDAIPHNAALMSKMGVTTAINSDDAEMARRLNQEAGKAVKYGGATEEEALKMVTLNPAKLLHLDDRMGSIKVGKDADLVLWTNHPLSIYAKADKTIIDGIIYYDAERDAELRKKIAQERTRLISKMIDAKNGGSFTQKSVSKANFVHKCSVFGHDVEEEF